MEKELLVNDKYIPLIENTVRHLAIYGSAGSGKSVFAAQKLVLRTQTETPHRFLALRKIADTIKESIFAELRAAIEEMDVVGEFTVNKTDKTFTHRPTGNQILCKGLDEPEKIKSIKGITGMWVEEATEFTPDDLAQLNLRIRGEKQNYVQFLYTFNPVSEDNPVVRKFVIDKPLPQKTEVHFTSYKDNHFLDNDYIAELENLKFTNPLYYDIYCLGIPGVVDKSGKFFYTFNSEKQVVSPMPPDRKLPLWLTFDFNIDPMTVTAAQRLNNSTLICYKSIQLNDSDIYAMCDRIQAEYPGFHYIVTGDASGHNRTGAVRGKTSYWKVIKEQLRLSDQQIQVRSINLGLIESRVLCNAVNQHLEIYLTTECEALINDCKYAKIDEKGVLEKDRKKQKNDFLDGLRYLIDANFSDYLDRPKKYR